MPITFNDDTALFEGANDFEVTLSGFDFSVFGGTISNNGIITAPVTGNSDVGIELVNTWFGSLSKAAGSQYAIDLTGNGGRLIVNDGNIFGSVRLGNGWDSFFNSGTIEGQVITGNGNDTLTNQIIAGLDGGPETAGTITGGVKMGNGDDTVLNTGVMAGVQLGAGNDTYTVGGFSGGDLGVDFSDDVSGDFFPGDVFEVDGGSGSSDDVRGGAGNDTMTGGTSGDRFYGGADDDRLFGNGGGDNLIGQNGNDDLYGGSGNDVISGGAGNDFISGGSNNDRLAGGNDNDQILGGHGNDNLGGGNGDDRMFGDIGHDRLAGGNGNDTMEGGQGRDLLIGGDGADVFVFGANSNRDEIRDFGAGDRIELLTFSFEGGVTYADVMTNTQFTGGDAVIDLSAIFNLYSSDARPDRGSVLTVNNVTIEDLDEDAFIFFDDIFIAG